MSSSAGSSPSTGSGFGSGSGVSANARPTRKIIQDISPPISHLTFNYAKVTGRLQTLSSIEVVSGSVGSEALSDLLGLLTKVLAPIRVLPMAALAVLGEPAVHASY